VGGHERPVLSLPGDTGFNGTSSDQVGWDMLAADPRKPAADNYVQPGLYPQFRHHVQGTKAVLGGNQLPIEGRANFCFLDGHARSLTIGQAMASPAASPPVEDGFVLRREPRPNHWDYDIEYLLWNIY
jgi:prepilin-type processing-associated H-X9-DG protein